MNVLNDYIEIFFDGRCYVCAAEIDIYKKRNGSEIMQFVDISHPDFSPEEHGLDEKAVNKEFHVKRRDGSIVKGVDAFIVIWEELPGWNWAAKAAALPIINHLMKVGYVVFSEVRPYLPRKKETCSEGVCFR